MQTSFFDKKKKRSPTLPVVRSSYCASKLPYFFSLSITSVSINAESEWVCQIKETVLWPDCRHTRASTHAPRLYEHACARTQTSTQTHFAGEKRKAPANAILRSSCSVQGNLCAAQSGLFRRYLLPVVFCQNKPAQCCWMACGCGFCNLRR